MSTALAMMFILTPRSKCEEKTNELKAHLYSLVELIDALGDYDYYKSFEKTNGVVTDFNTEEKRLRDGINYYMDFRYNDDVHEVGRSDANAAIFNLSKQIFSNLISDFFNVSIYDVDLKKKFENDSFFYDVIIKKDSIEFHYRINPSFSGKDNELYDFVHTMELCYNHDLRDDNNNYAILIAYENLKNVLATKKVVMDDEMNLGLTFDYDKADLISKNVPSKK